MSSAIVPLAAGVAASTSSGIRSWSVPLPALPMTGERRTIAREVEVRGVGLHLGLPCRLSFRPAPTGRGILFRRVDLPEAAPVPAHVSRGGGGGATHAAGDGARRRCTRWSMCWRRSAALEIDDLVIGMDAPEPPIMDGSAEPFLRGARGGRHRGATAGVAEVLLLRESGAGGGRRVGVRGAPGRRRSSSRCAIDFPHPLIGQQRGQLSRDAGELLARAGRGAHVRVRWTRWRTCARRG